MENKEEKKFLEVRLGLYAVPVVFGVTPDSDFHKYLTEHAEKGDLIELLEKDLFIKEEYKSLAFVVVGQYAKLHYMRSAGVADDEVTGSGSEMIEHINNPNNKMLINSVDALTDWIDKSYPEVLPKVKHTLECSDGDTKEYAEELHKFEAFISEVISQGVMRILEAPIKQAEEPEEQ